MVTPYLSDISYNYPNIYAIEKQLPISTIRSYPLIQNAYYNY